MRIQFISDLHLERQTSFPRLVSTAPNLFLLGDIGDPTHRNYRDFMCYVSHNWNKVFYVTGNHEYTSCVYQYPYLRYQTDETIAEILALKAPNVTHLNCDTARLGSYTIAGCTFWSEMTNPIAKCFHQQQVVWLKKILQCSSSNPVASLLVLTHHVPSYKTWASVPPVAAWFYGHNHHPPSHTGFYFINPQPYIPTKPFPIAREITLE